MLACLKKMVYIYARFMNIRYKNTTSQKKCNFKDRSSRYLYIGQDYT